MRKIANIVVGRARNFLAPILRRADKWRRQVIPTLLVGIAKAQTLVVAEVARQVRRPASKGRLEQTVLAAWKSLRRHLNSKAWDRFENEVNEDFEAEVGRRVDPLTPIAFDPTEVAKPRAQKMEHLGLIRDADESARRGSAVIVPGYWQVTSFAFPWDLETPVPLVNLIYSLEDPKGPKSQNEAFGIAFGRIRRATGGNGVLLIDRRGDADYVLQELQDLQLRSVVRMRGDRLVQDELGRCLGAMGDLIRAQPEMGEMVLKARRGGRKVKVLVEYRWKQIWVPGLRGPRWLIGVHAKFQRIDKRETEGWWYLLTDVPVQDARDAERVIRWYSLRWLAEESIQFVKEELGQEEVRVLKFRGIRRLVQLTYWFLALCGFVLLDLAARTRRSLWKLAEVLRVVAARFLAYRVRRAIARIFENRRTLWKFRAEVAGEAG